MINIENLKRAREYVDKHVPEDKICMESYRSLGDFDDIECGSSGCIIGHTTCLDKDNILKNFVYDDDCIMFRCWSNYFYFNAGHYSLSSYDHVVWDFLFDSGWPSSKSLALNRMDYVIKHQAAPEDWDYSWTEEVTE